MIGVDVGTSVTKAVLFSQAGEEILVKEKRTQPQKRGSGFTEHDMWEIWCSVQETLIKLTAESPIPLAKVAAIGLTAQGDGTWLLDAKGDPVCAAISWLDGRTAQIVSDWEESGLARQVFSLTGTVLSTSLQSSQLRWLSQNHPEILQKTKVVFHAKDWVFYQLTGDISIEYSETSHVFFDRHKGEFSDEIFGLLELQEWTSRLPTIKDALQSLAGLKPAISEKLGLKKDIPVVRGPFDVVCSTLGVGGFEEGNVVSIVGSSSIHNQVLDEWFPPSEYSGHTVDMGFEGKLLRMFGSMSGTLNLDWAVGNLFIKEGRALVNSDFLALEREMAEISPGSEGVIYLPFIDAAGERSPFVKPSARAVFFGLHSDLSIPHMLKAVYEGVALSARDNYTRMPFSFDTVGVAGGGSRSDYWMQLWANVTGKRVCLTEGREFGARGAAIVAGVATGVFSSFPAALQQMIGAQRFFEPDPSEVVIYDEIYDLYVNLYRSLWQTWDQAYKIFM